MSKKSMPGLDSLLGEDQVKKAKINVSKVGRPVTQFKTVTKSSQEGTKEGEIRATFIVKEDILEKLKAIAYWDRLLIKDVVNTALEDTVSRYEKKNGPIKPIPNK